MTYTSPETIPAKLYFKILETGNLRLLTDEKYKSNNELQEVWNGIEEAYAQISIGSKKDQNKKMNIYRKLESLSSKMESISLSIYHLRSVKDKELLDLLEGYGYKFNWKESEKETEVTEGIFQNDLDKIERETEGLELKIKAEQRKLPKPKENTEEVPFDETLLMYAAFTDLGYVDPNIIPLTQYDAIIANGNKKMKSLE